MKSKILETQRLQGRLADAGDFPRVVLIDTISYCNLKCSMCVHKEMKRKKGIMPWDLFARIIDEIAEVDKNIRVWMVFFGEALLLKRRNPSIFDMIAYAKNKGLTDVVLNSNANLLDETAAQGLISAGLDALYIGLDAFTPETYRQVRVGGNYRLTVRNIIRLMELKKALNAPKPDVFVQFVEMDVNQAEKEDFIAFWNAQGAQVKIRPKDRWPCYWVMQTMSITDAGKVVTCAVDLDARHIAGDVSQRTLREVWNGGLKELRRLHLEKQFEELPENCRNCRDWQSARADYYSVNS